MTIVDHRTGELLDAPSYGEVKASVESAKNSLEAAAEQIVWQIENRAWTVLGYRDWNEMREAEYGGAAFMVPKAERPELVARMRRSGLTQQEIADTAGVNAATVSRDLANASSEVPATITNSRGQQRPASYSRPASTSHPEDEWTPLDEAVTEFPDLAYYANTDRATDAVNMAADLRVARDRGELDQRLDTLRRSIAVDRSKRDGTYRPGTTAVMGEDGEYRMAPLAVAPATTHTCPTCNGRGVIEE